MAGIRHHQRKRRTGTGEGGGFRKRLFFWALCAALATTMVAWYLSRLREITAGGKSGAIAPDSGKESFGPQGEKGLRGGESRAGGGRGDGLLTNIAKTFLLEPGSLSGGSLGGRKVVAFAVTLTKDGSHLDGAVVLAASIDNVCATSEFLCDLVAFLHDDIGPLSENVLRRVGFRVIRPGLPLALDDIQNEATRNLVESGGCCGVAELLKIFAYTLTEYHRVVHLDTDVLVLQSFDALLNANESLLYTPDVNMANKYSPILPVQGGFLVIRPDERVFEYLVEIVKNTPFSRTRGWGNSGVGLFWGGITVQGLLPYYYEHRAAPEYKYRAVDRCAYNNMVDTAECRNIGVEEVRSVHFTNCEKPWSCVYPHPKQPLCSIMFKRWFGVRAQVEKNFGLQPSKPCPNGFRNEYTPLLLPDK